MEILKHVMPNIVKPFTYICNKSFIEGCFPDKMKISMIVPVFKAGDKSSLNNYAPISVLPQFSKIIKKLFESRSLNVINSKKKTINIVLGVTDQQQLPSLIYLKKFQLFWTKNIQL